MGTIWSRESHPSHGKLGYEVSRSYTQGREIKIQSRLLLIFPLVRNFKSS